MRTGPLSQLQETSWGEEMRRGTRGKGRTSNVQSGAWVESWLGYFPALRPLDKCHSSSEPLFPHLSEETSSLSQEVTRRADFRRWSALYKSVAGEKLRGAGCLLARPSKTRLAQQQGMAGLCSKGPHTSREDMSSKAPRCDVPSWPSEELPITNL